MATKKKKVKNTNYSIGYRCGICGCFHGSKTEVEDCCEPCEHDTIFDGVDDDTIHMYCTKCDYCFGYEIDYSKLIEYADKNHKKSKFLKKEVY